MWHCDMYRRSNSSLSNGDGVHRRQERTTDVRGASKTWPHVAVLGHRREWHCRHWGSGDRRVLVPQHGNAVTRHLFWRVFFPSLAVRFPLHFFPFPSRSGPSNPAKGYEEVLWAPPTKENDICTRHVPWVAFLLYLELREVSGDWKRRLISVKRNLIT